MNKKINDFLDFQLNIYLKNIKFTVDFLHGPYYFFFSLFFLIPGGLFICVGDFMAKCIGFFLCMYSISSYIYYKKNKKNINVKIFTINYLNLVFAFDIACYMMSLYVYSTYFQIQKLHGLPIIILFIILNIIGILILLVFIMVKDYNKLINKNYKQSTGLLVFVSTLSVITVRYLSENRDKFEKYIALIMLIFMPILLVRFIVPAFALLICRNLDYDIDQKEKNEPISI